MSLPTNFFIGRGGASSGPVGGTSATAATVSEMYAAGNVAGIYWHKAITGVQSGQPFQVRYKPYNNKGWVNTFISSMTDPRDDDNWAYSSNAGWDNQQGNGTTYWLKTGNLGTNGLVVGNAGGGASVLLLGPNWGATDFMCTSVNTNTEANLVATVSGTNSGGALPLLASQSISNGSGNFSAAIVSTVKTRIFDYFTGDDSGFNFHAISTASGTNDEYQACWEKYGPNGPEKFGMFMHNRGGPQSDHWYIAASSPSSALQNTYSANIGYRGTSFGATWSSYDSANIGSWAQNGASGAPSTAFSTSAERISTSNAISIWLTNM